MLDGLMKELGLDGSSLGGLAEAAAKDPKAVEKAIENWSFETEDGSNDGELGTDEAAE